MARILILDDRGDYLRALRGALRREFEVTTTSTVEEAKQALNDTIRVALIDVRLSEEDQTNRDGIVFLQWAKTQFPDTPVVMMSAYRDFDALVEAVNRGADHFLKKPIDLGELKRLLRDFAEHGPGPERTAELKQRIEEER